MGLDFESYKKLLGRLRESKGAPSGERQERAAGIRQAAKEAGMGKVEGRQEYRKAKDLYRQQRADAAAKAAAEAAGAQRAAETPGAYMSKYGSQGPDIYQRDQLRTAYVPADYKEKYGSQAESMYRRDTMNRNQIAAAQETYAAGSPEQRQKALAESISLAQGASQPSSPEAVREFYRKTYAAQGTSPNVIGMKDINFMENTGLSGGDINRIALTVGNIGPNATQYLRQKYGAQI